MNYTATLSSGEIQILSNDNEPLQDTTRAFEKSIAAGRHSDESAFEKSLKIKNTLDVFEEKAKQEPSWSTLAVLVNCEYQLWHIYAGTPLRLNPFLSHWVEAIRRLDGPGSPRRRVSIAFDSITTEEIVAARVLWIKTLMQGTEVERSLDATPSKVSHILLKRGLHDDFDLQPYIRMLEEEGIYEKSYDREAAASSSSAPQKVHKQTYAPGGTASSSSLYARADYEDYETPAWVEEHKKNHLHEIAQFKEDIIMKLKERPDDAIRQLTRLPIELTFLDFLNTLLTDRTLEKHNIDPAPVITEFVQHALRLVEEMEKPPTPPQDPAADGHESPWAAKLVELEYGKDAQSRAVRLVLLFIKNLIRKGLVGTEVLYFEIQEICVRYVWIREVREFRAWVEEGDGEDDAG